MERSSDYQLAKRRSSRSSMTRTISFSDNSFVVTPPAITGVIRKL